jgi:hypothetical protein
MPRKMEHLQVVRTALAMNDSDVTLRSVDRLQGDGNVAHLVEGTLVYCVNAFHESGQPSQKFGHVLTAPPKLSLDASPELIANTNTLFGW